MLIAHSALYLLARGLPGAINFLAIIVFTRLLVPGAYGQYALVMSAVALLNVLFFQWLRLSLARFFPAEIGNPEPLLATVLALFAAIALAIGVTGAALLAVIWDPAWQKLIAITVPLLWAHAWFELNLAMAVTKLNPVRYGWLSGTKAILALVLGALFVTWGYGAYGPLFGLLIALLIMGVIGARGSWPRFDWRLERARVSQIARYGIPLTATLLLGYIVSTSDRFLLAALLDLGAAGQYSAAYDLGSQGLTVLFMVVNLAANPLLIRALEFHGAEAARHQARHNAVLLLTVALPAASGIAILSPDIASVVIGPDFSASAALILPIVALASVLAGLRAYYFDLAFQLGHWTMGQAWIIGVAALINIALNLWWIPVLGIAGAAWATVVAYLCALGLSAVLGRRVFPLPFPWHAAARIVLATAVMLTAVWLVPGDPGLLRLILRMLAAAAAFAGAAFMLGVVRSLKPTQIAGN
jgi:O-antigen/teichoic acid export membrane protein